MLSNQHLNNPSLSCLNHLKHGATATSLFLKDEDPSAFFALLDDAFAEHQPGSQQAAGIVTRTVHDHWMLLRRERVCDNFEANLLDRQIEPEAADFHQLNLYDRYKTSAARAYSRSLRDLQNQKRMKRDEARWQHHLESQKQKYALDLERFNRAQAKQDQQHTEDPFPDLPFPPPSSEPPADMPENSVQQAIYIGIDEGQTVVFETTPANEDLSRQLTPECQVIRTYYFVGSVPPAYQHLITPDAVRWGKSTSVQHTYSYDDWFQLITKE